MVNTCREFELLHRARGATANEGSSTAHEGLSLMAGGGTVLCIFWYQVGEKYHPTPLGTVKKMMRSNAESLMAGAWAVYLYFDTESMQNIIQSLIGSGVAVMKRMRGKNIIDHFLNFY